MDDFVVSPATLDKMYNWFWSEWFWLPEGFTWKDFQSTATVRKADVNDLKIIPLLVIAISVVRYIFERFIAQPFCKYIGIKSEVVSKETKVFEIIYQEVTKHPDMKQLNDIVSETGFTKQQVNAWFRKRNKQRNKVSLMKKSTESCYRAMAYLFLFCYGSFVLLRTDWFWHSSTWLTNYISTHSFTEDMKWYYFIELSFYFSLLASQFYDTRRKDFLQMFVHHVATITLLLGSYILSLYRFGAIILCLHDAADVWLEAAKVANYAKVQKVCDALFGIFAIVFFVTRLVYYPIWVAYSYFHYNVNNNSIFHNTLITLCFLLLFLHFFWGWLIARMVYRLSVLGKVDKDTRSDTEDDSDDDNGK